MVLSTQFWQKFNTGVEGEICDVIKGSLTPAEGAYQYQLMDQVRRRGAEGEGKICDVIRAWWPNSAS